jgi:undecaprenyl-phosphate galactose phosphotransferase
LGKEKVLIIGTTENGIKFMKAIEAEPNLGYEVVGFIDDKTELKDIEEIQTIVISDPNVCSKEIFQLFSKNPTRFRTIFYIPEVKQIPVIGTEIRYFFQEDIFALELKNNLANPLNYFLKRAIDYLITLILLPLIMPLFIFIALLVKTTSKGPVIFSHERVGKGGKTFKCYKIRTMYIDAEEKLKQILETNPEVKVEWETKYKLTNDPRVTPIGKFLRKTSLDELPQIFNVLKGEMSLIGPRPVTKEELDKYYKEKAELYCLIPPGITGLWQVSGRSNLTYEERVNLDCWYIRNWSLWLDLVILLKTVKVVLKGEGAC